MAARKILLNSLLRALVQEWGHKEVESALKQISEVRGFEGGMPEGNQRSRSEARLLATEQVARARLPETQGLPLRELAARFDRKQFLPSVFDAREFLVMMGQRPGAMKDRSQAFRQILKALSSLPPERLERLATSALHSGPSQLGPLSDAISAAAASLPRHREPIGSLDVTQGNPRVVETADKPKGTEPRSHNVARGDARHRSGTR